MPTFDAGSIESRLTLDRSDFNHGLDQAQSDGERFEARTFTASAELNTAAATASLDRLEQRLATLGGGTTDIRTSGVDAALSQLTAIQAAADRLDGREINLRIQLIGQAQAASQLTALDALANRLDGRNININARANTSSTSSDLDTLSSKLYDASSKVPLLVSAVAGLGPALVPIGIAALGAAAGLVSLAASGGGALGVFAGATLGAVKASQEHATALATANTALSQAKTAYDSASASATQSAAAVTTAKQAVVNAQAAVGQASQQAAQAVQQAKDQVVTAQQAESKAATDAAASIQTAKDNVVAAKQAEAKAATQSAQQIQQAKDQVVSAQQAETKAVTTAQQSIQSAQQTLANAQQAVGVAAQAAAKQVQSAKDAVVTAQQQQQTATQNVTNAEFSLSSALSSDRDAQLALTQARIDAQRALQDMNASLKDAQLSEVGAKLGVEEAQQALNQANAAGSTATELQRQEAQLAYEEAVQHLSEQTTATKRLQTDTKAANDAGVNGSKQVIAASKAQAQADGGVVQASQQLAAARQSASNAALSTARAQQAVTDAQATGARSVAQAQQSAADAAKALANAQVNGAASVLSAQQGVAKAQQAVATAQTNGAASVAAAQATVEKAVKSVTLAQVNGADSVRSAQEAVAKAQSGVVQAQVNGARQVATAQQGVVSAQQGLAQAQASAAKSSQAAAVAASALAAAQEKQNLASKLYSPIERELTGSLTGLKTAYNSFIASTEKTSLAPVITVIHALTDALPHLIPLVKAVAPVAQDVANAFSHWVNGGGLDKAVAFLTTDGVPVLKKFELGARSLLGVAGDLIRTFGPFGVAIAGNLEKGAAALGKWSSGGGFDRFMLEVRQYAPQVEHFLSLLGAAIGQVGTAAKNNGPAMLGLVSAMLMIIAHTPVPVLQAILIALALYRPAMLLSAAATWLFEDSQIAARNGLVASRIATAAMVVWAGISTVATRLWTLAQTNLNLAFFASPIGLIILGIAALVTAIVLIATRTTWFQTAWKYTWNFVKQIASDVWGWLRVNWKTLVEAMIVIFTGGVGLLPVLFVRYFGDIKSYASNVWGWMQTAWKYTVDFILEVFNAFIGNLKKGWNDGWTWIRDTGKKLWNDTTGIITGGLHTLESTWDTIWGRIKSTFSTTLTDIKTSANTIWKDIKTAFKDPINVVIGFYNNGIAAIGNDILKAFGIKAKIPDIQKLASGGALAGGTHGVDSIPVMGMPGEHMLTTEDVQAMGGQANVYKFRNALHMAGGGAIGPASEYPGGILPSVNDKIPKSKGSILDQLEHLGAGAVKSTVGAAEGAAKGAAHAVSSLAHTAIGDVESVGKKLLAGTVGHLVDPLINKAESLVTGSIGKVGTLGSALATGINTGVLDQVKAWITGQDTASAASGGAAGAYGSAGAKVQYGGVTLDSITLTQLKKAFGLAGGSFGLSQGSFNDSVGASAGTHSGGGALDVAGVAGMSIARQVAVVKGLREAGFAAWRRTPEEGFVDHIHAELLGDPLASPQAKAQWPDYFAHKDGLADHGVDDNPIDVKAGWFGSSAPQSGGDISAAGVKNEKTWAQALLKGLGEPLSGPNLQFIYDWELSEGGLASNPLNVGIYSDDTARPDQSIATGLAATVKAINQGYYTKVRAGMAASNYAEASEALWESPWAASHYGYGSKWATTAYANGTSGAAPGWAQVGEKGMEWIYMQGGETVLPHGVTPTGLAGSAPGYATGTQVTLTGHLPGSGQQAADSRVVTADQDRYNKLRTQQAAEREKIADEKNKYRKKADQAELATITARISSASALLSQAKQVQTADTRAMTAASKAAQTSADAVTKNLRSWVDTQLATLKSQLTAADDLRNSYLSAAQGIGSLSTTSPTAPSTLGASFAGDTKTLTQLTSNIQRLDGMGLSPGLQGQILALDPGDALTYSNNLLRQTGGGSIAQLNQQYNSFQTAASNFANISANSVSGLNGIQQAYNELSGATVHVNVTQPKTMILTIDGKQFKATVAATVETEVTSILAKAQKKK